MTVQYSSIRTIDLAGVAQLPCLNGQAFNSILTFLLLPHDNTTFFAMMTLSAF